MSMHTIAHTAVLCGLAENRALPHELLDVLIRDGDEQMLTDIAAREDLTGRQIENLAASGSLSVITSLVHAGHMPLPPDLLDDEQSLRTLALWNQIPETHLPHLASHPDPQIREAVAQEADRLPPDAVRTLAADQAVAVVIGIAGCADLPEDLARALAAHPDRAVRSALATNPSATPDVLGSLAETGGHPPITTCGACRNNPAPSARCGDHAAGIAVIQDAALRNEHTPTRALALHIGHPDPSLRATIAERTDLPPELLTILADDIEDAVRAGIAANPACPTRLLRTLAHDRATVVRRAVALNPQVPLDLLYELAARTRLNLRAGIPAIENATLDQIRDLARSRIAQVRALAASRTDLPEDLVRTLADDPDPGVAKQLADHPSLDADDVRLLVARHGPRVYSAAASNPNCPPELLHTMTRNSATVPKALRDIARHPAAEPRTLLLCLTDPQARPHAAAHPHLPAETLTALLDDPEWAVANNAAANPSLPTETMRARIR
ncbi:MAG TPA: hypothetical protein VFN97_14535 [Actinospica sp.]|nr:hypothetical protein [Actinospica sp.]